MKTAQFEQQLPTKGNTSLKKISFYGTSLYVSLLTILNIYTAPSMAVSKISQTEQISTVNSENNVRLVSQYICRLYRVTRRYGLYVYHGNEIVDTIPYNTIVVVKEISFDGDWTYVYYQGGSGWVATRHLACYQE